MSDLEAKQYNYIKENEKIICKLARLLEIKQVQRKPENVLAISGGKVEAFVSVQSDFNLELEKTGLNSLGIVTIISFFIGAVVSIQTAFNFESPLYPKYLIGYATRESLILEFCPTMLALILAGKVGSNIASEIGSMRVTEQIDALEIMGVNSASFLILPKIFATVLFFPILIPLQITLQPQLKEQLRPSKLKNLHTLLQLNMILAAFTKKGK